MYTGAHVTPLHRYLSTYGSQDLTTTIKRIEVEAPDRTKGCSRPVAPPLAADQANELADLWRALGDPTRVQMIHILAAATEPVCVCDFTAAFDLGQPTISHRLAKLREAGFVTCFKRGLWSFYQLNPEMSAQARLAVRLIP
jgi:ArsR family transcriptional regulator